MKSKILTISLVLVCLAGCLMARHFNLINYTYLEKHASKAAYGKKEIDSMIQFAIRNNMNSHQGFIFNVGQHSGSNRFFLVDFDTRKVLVEGLCCHGSGSATFDEDPEVSNVIGGYCTSVGYYKIGYKYNGGYKKRNDTKNEETHF